MYEIKTFELGELAGISERTIKEHLGLYAGYVKHVNLIQEKIQELSVDVEKNTYALAEVQRRMGFEFGGMKNHEYYFEQFVGGSSDIPSGTLKTMIEAQFDSVDAFVLRFKTIALTRGVGWAMLYIDKATNQLVTTWVDEQHIGQLADVKIVLALDMWEHSYMLDYAPSEKKQYVEAFFKNLNWSTVAARV